MQMPDRNQHYSDEALEAPPKLVAALKRLPQEPSFIPPTADEAVLWAARRHLEGPRQVRWGLFRFLPWVAAAATVVLILALPLCFKQRAPGPSGDPTLARGDLNRDGRVDVLDAFALARQLKQGKSKDLQLDLNGDGVVDEHDAETLAARAVKLDRR